jgi:hypothetical protein
MYGIPETTPKVVVVDWGVVRDASELVECLLR